MLGEAQLRFLPSRFTVEGNALDALGLVCHTIACPRCHLPLPKALLEYEPLFVSILGSPSCGKSYYLASLVWSLRKSLPSLFGINLTDADAISNQSIIKSEETLYLNELPHNPVPLSDLIAKTQLQGDMYHSVRQGQLIVSYPCPFSFLMEPTPMHPRHGVGAPPRVLCLYDNAGEHFLPGNDSVMAPGTRHLATSSLLLFLYDPTQDRRLDDAISRANGGTSIKTRHAGRQEAILREAAARIRRYSGSLRSTRHSVPLIVVVTKFDLWSSLLDGVPTSDPWFRSSRLSVAAINREEIERRSVQLRSVLRTYVPEIVQAAEEFAETVYYVPVSALGSPPSIDEHGRPWMEPAKIRPTNVDVPLIFGLSLAARSLFLSVTKSSPSSRQR